jgi:hypothetical protein
LISMLSDWVSFLSYLNLFGIKCFVVVVVVMQYSLTHTETAKLWSNLKF